MEEWELHVARREANCDASALEKRMRFEIPIEYLGFGIWAASIGASCTP